MRTVTTPRWIGSTGKLSWLLICLVVITWCWLIDLLKACLLSFDSFLTGTPRSFSKPTWPTDALQKDDTPSGPSRGGVAAPATPGNRPPFGRYGPL